MNYHKELQNPIFNIVSKVADQLSYPTYVVGGWVRDMLINRKQNKTDIDFVCIGSGIELAKRVSALLKGSELNYFKNFGTAMINYNGENYEFVGARKESYRNDSRKPIVENGNLKDDQNRRDFTINAMSIQLNNEKFGDFLDPFNGMKDLQEKRISTPLDADITFSDDPLRMMRAVRFASQLNFTICTETFKAIKRNSSRLSIISQERITEELNKIILTNKPSIGFKLLFDSKLLQEFFKEFTYLHGIERKNNHAHKDNFYHTLEVLDNIARKTDDLWLRWAAILHDIATPQTKKYEVSTGWTFHAHEFIGSKMTPKIFKRLKLPLNHKMFYVKKLVLLHLRPIVLAQEIVTDSAIRRLLFDAGEDIEDLMTLCDADITSKNPNKVKKYLSNFQLVRKKLIEIEEKDRVRNFQPPIDGHEIIKIFKISSGKQIGQLKHAIKEAILDGLVKNEKKDAEKFLRKKAKELNIETL